MPTVADAAENFPTQVGQDRQPPPPRRPPAPPGTPPAEDPQPIVWERLIIAGKDRGYVTRAEIHAVFKELDVEPPPDLGPVFQLLRSLGIEIERS